MAKRKQSGSKLICKALESLGVTHVFGIPGTQNVTFFEALRRSHMRTVLATHEGGAGFMANGYYRASGRVGVFTTIGGPGFTNALTPLAEARDDSAAVLYIVKAPPEGAEAFRLQDLDQATIAASIAKAVFTISAPEHAALVICEAHSTALADEPGPVVVQVTSGALNGSVNAAAAYDLSAPFALPETSPIDTANLDSIVALLRSARRPVIYAGQGCNRASDKLIEFAELVNAPVIMTRSARGVVPMDHRLALAFDYNTNGAAGCNALLAAADLVFVLGCKLGHNGSAGFRIQFPPDKTVRVDASTKVLRANYPGAVEICADVAYCLSALLARRSEFSHSRRAWTDADLATWRNPIAAEWGDGPAEPKFPTSPDRSAKHLFDMLRRALPPDAIVVTDSGLHQVLTFRHWRSFCPAGIIAPTDFQSMGFGIPAAIGAKLACPDRHVVAIVGDGGFAMTGMELLTAVRENLQLSVIVFNDGALGQIRVQQFSNFGVAHATTLFNPGFSLFAESIGAAYVLLDSPSKSDALNRSGVTLCEVPIEDSMAIKTTRAKGTVRRTATAVGGAGALRWLKSLRKRQCLL